MITARPRLLSLTVFVAACIEVSTPSAEKATPSERAVPAVKAAVKAEPAEKAEPAVQAEPAANAEPSVPGQFDVLEPVAPAPASFELLDAGTEPRTAITIAAKKGDRTVVRIGLAMDVAMHVGTSDVPKTTLPKIDVELAAEVTKVDDAGIELTLRVVDVRTDDTAVASERVKSAVLHTIEALRTTTGMLVTTPEGRVQSIALAGVGDPSRPSYDSAIESKAAGLDHAIVELLPAWPTEPVGVGARWRMLQSVVRGGVTLQRTSEFRLVGQRDGALELEVATTHVAVTGGDASQGETRIEAQSGEARGRIVVGAGDVLPRTAEITAHTTTRASFAGAAKGVLVAVDLATSLARADTGR